MNVETELQVTANKLRRLIAIGEGLLKRIDGLPDLNGVQPMNLKKVETIVTMVSKHMGVPERLVHSRDRCEDTALTRMMCMALARDELGLSLHQIGKCFRRNHGTVMHARRAVKDRCDVDNQFAAAFHYLREEIRKEIQP